ncbi:MAG: methyltransferase domain-containing protein [Candidatus Omnitrophica bacterium]|nr:methyltransferase domain-containing protein [Candidatus Omnitrophota bacterium]
MKLSTLSILACPNCKAGGLRPKVFVRGEEEGTIKEGTLYCDSCSQWYPVAGFIPVLVNDSSLLNEEKKLFAERWDVDIGKSVGAVRELDLFKKRQIEHYNKDAFVYDHLVAGSIFWRASDWNTIYRWLDFISKGALVLDLGCGTGRCSIPLAASGKTVIGVDISKEMLKKAICKSKDSVPANMPEYIMADAENLPFKEAIFDAIIGFGILHHVSSPERAMKQVSRVLKNDGKFYALENNKSRFRFLFEVLMRLKKLWNEEGGSHPLISAGEIREWGLKSDIDISTESSTFIPPHLFNLLNVERAKKLLVNTDKLFEKLPFFHGHGGQLLIFGRKMGQKKTAV